MPLIEMLYGHITYGGGGPVRAVIKGKVEVIVVNSLIVVGILEHEIQGDGGIRGVIRGFVEGRDVNFFDGAYWHGGSEAQPQEQGGETRS